MTFHYFVMDWLHLVLLHEVIQECTEFFPSWSAL